MGYWPKLTPGGTNEQHHVHDATEIGGQFESLDVAAWLTLVGQGGLRTAEDGQRIVLTNVDNDRVIFYSGDSDEDEPAYIAAFEEGGDPVWYLVGPTEGTEKTYLLFKSGAAEAVNSGLGGSGDGRWTFKGFSEVHSHAPYTTDVSGTLGSPAFGYADYGTGVYFPATGRVGLAAGGTQALFVTGQDNAVRIRVAGSVQLVKAYTAGAGAPAGGSDRVLYVDGTA